MPAISSSVVGLIEIDPDTASTDSTTNETNFRGDIGRLSRRASDRQPTAARSDGGCRRLRFDATPRGKLSGGSTIYADLDGLSTELHLELTMLRRRLRRAKSTVRTPK